MWLLNIKDHYARIRQEIHALTAIALLAIMGGILNKTIRTWPRPWGKELGFSVRTFDVLAVLGMFYSLKLIWSPLLSLRLPPWLPFSPRRFWISVHLWLFSGLFLLLSTCQAFSGCLFFLCVGLLFMLDGNFSMLVVACQKDTVPSELRGIPESFCLNGYSAGMMIAISGALVLSDYAWSWPMLYRGIAGICLVMGLVILWAPQFNSLDLAPIHPLQSTKYNFFTPIKQLFQHPKIRVILFILMVYRIPDHLWTPNQELFFLHMGFSKQQYSLQYFWNFWGSILGVFVSGYCIRRFSPLRVMQWGMGLQMLVLLGLLAASFGAPLYALSFLCIAYRVVFNFALTSVFAFQLMTVNLGQAVTQLSVFTALAHANSELVSAQAGWLIERLGWSGMILVTVCTCVPALMLMGHVSKKGELHK